MSKMSLPKGWVTKPLGYIASIIMGQSPDSKFYSEEEKGLPFLQGCAEFQVKFPKHTLYCSQIKKVALDGAILFSVRAPVGKLNVANRDYIIGRGLAAITGRQINQNYLEYFLNFEEPNFRNASQGSTFEAINSSELNGWLIHYPHDETEQSKIAEILSTVDRAIEQTEALIAKQQRIKTGLMQDLLTRGIDEHGNLRSEETHEFKDSPLGRIPVEWSITTLNECVPTSAPICYGILMPGGGHDGGVPVIKVKDIIGGRIVQDDILLTAPKIDEQYRRSRLQAGDVLLTIRGTTGRVAIVPPELDGANITQDTARVRLNEGLSNQFFYFLLQSFWLQDQIQLHTLGQAVKGINIGEVKRLFFGLPREREQEEIACRLAAIQQAIDKSEVELLKQRSLKTALMQDLLTGKVRVTPLLEI